MSEATGLKLGGMKNTRQRTAILKILEKLSQPVSAEEIYAQLLEKEISVSLSTVYRALDAMVANDFVTKLNLNSSSKALYELNCMEHRHYLICLGCKKILSIMHCPIEAYEEKLAAETGFTVTGHKLDVYGYCPGCIKKGLLQE